MRGPPNINQSYANCTITDLFSLRGSWSSFLQPSAISLINSARAYIRPTNSTMSLIANINTLAVNNDLLYDVVAIGPEEE